MSPLKQNTTKKKQVDKPICQLEFDNNNNSNGKKYEIKII